MVVEPTVITEPPNLKVVYLKLTCVCKSGIIIYIFIKNRYIIYISIYLDIVYIYIEDFKDKKRVCEGMR